MRKFAVVLYVRNEGSTEKFNPWAFTISSDSRANAPVRAIDLARKMHMETYCVYAVLDLPDSVG